MRKFNKIFWLVLFTVFFFIILMNEVDFLVNKIFLLIADGLLAIDMLIQVLKDDDDNNNDFNFIGR